MQAALYWHTLRHLRPIQIWGRAAFAVRKPRPDGATPPPLRQASGAWALPPRRPESMLDAGRFRFLNVERELAGAADWNHDGWPKLWLYNLHYFDDLASAAFGATAQRWIGENPPAAGNGWEPYPCSLRIVNWIKWALAGNALPQSMAHSLALQCRHLEQRLEWHLLGNHLLANAKALVFAGHFHDGPEAQRWLTRGLEILSRELREQILPGGAHFELSPMYHSIILEDLIDLLNLSRVYPGLQASLPLAATASRMLGWLRHVTHPDGGIAFFNDAAFGIASEPGEIAAYAASLGVLPSVASAAEIGDGYLRVEQDGSCAILDVAPIGPDYLPGHAHADTLSFELSLFGQRVLVNSGTSTYEASAERLRQRSTAAHNTLEVNGENSSEIWASFRVARRARPIGLETLREAVCVRVRCGHDGYRRLRGRPVHRREWVFAQGSMQVIDQVEGEFGEAVARFHFHPDCGVPQGDGQSGSLQLAQGQRLRWSINGGCGRLVGTTWHPQFGVAIPGLCLEVLATGARLVTQFDWKG